MVKSAARKHLSFLAWKPLGFLRAGDTLIADHASGSGQVIKASLLDAGETATELELLRTVASGLGVVWGQDDLGAWALVPNEPSSAFAAAQEPAIGLPHALYREDDNGARFLIARYATQTEAEAKAAELARGGHKQHYFVQPLGQNDGGCSCESLT